MNERTNEKMSPNVNGTKEVTLSQTYLPLEHEDVSYRLSGAIWALAPVE